MIHISSAGKKKANNKTQLTRKITNEMTSIRKSLSMTFLNVNSHYSPKKDTQTI